MTAEAKKHIEERFFDGYPQHELDYIGDHRLRYIAELMESYANQKSLNIIEQAVGEVKSRERFVLMPPSHVADLILKTVRRELKRRKS